MSTKRLSVAFAVALLLAGWIPGPAAEEQKMEAPKPGPEHQRLARFLGTWAGEGDMKPSPMGPGGKFTWSETCEWFEGGFALVCKSEGSSPMGPSKGIGIMTYNPGEKVYTYYGLDSRGNGGYSKGTVSGDTWSFTNEGSWEGKPYKSRFTLKETSPTSHTFNEELTTDGQTWTPIFGGRATKK